MKGNLLRQRASLKLYPLLGLVTVCAVAAVLTFPSAARGHFGCTLAPNSPTITGSYPNQSAFASGVVFCDAEYSGDIRLRGWTGSSWNVLATNPTYCPPGCGAHMFYSDPRPCVAYNYVDTFMYANFGGHGHTNNSGSSACNFP